MTSALGRLLARRGPALAAAAVLVLAAAAPLSALTAEAPRSHEVRGRETLAGIARQYGVSAKALAAVNQLRSARARLEPGRVLTIPAAPAVRGRAVRAPARVRTAVATRPVVKPQRVSLRGGRGLDVFGGPPPGLLLAVPELEPAAPPFLWPVEGTVSSAFGRRRMGWHRGVDIVAPQGSPVIAAAPGAVIASGFEYRYGRVVKIEHDGGFITVYAHNLDNLVRVGDIVGAGQGIATVGQTGRATSPHLHFEVRHEGRVVNPLYLLPFPPRVSVDEAVDETEGEDE